jgi:hypothetical protein
VSYQRGLLTSLAIVVAVTGAAACSGEEASPVRPAQPPSSAAPTAVDGGEPQPTSQVSMAAIGQAFKLFEEGDGATIPVDVTVTRFRCGIKGYPFKASSVSGSIPDDAPAVPSSGQQFCQADLSVKNVGRKPLKDGVQPGNDALVMVDETEYTSTDLSGAIVFTILSNANNTGKNVGWFAGDVINPGQSVQQAQVWEIPVESRPTSIDFASPLGYGVDTASVRVNVP